MELILEAAKYNLASAEEAVVRLLVLNDSYEPVIVDRRLLVGPNPVPDRSAGIPFPVSVEPAFATEKQNEVALNPWCFYGRQRVFDNLPPGSVTLYAYLLKRSVDALLPQGPRETEALLVAAQPLVLTVEG